MITTDNISNEYHIEIQRYEGDFWDRYICYWTLEEALEAKEKIIKINKNLDYKYRIAKIDKITTRTILE